MIIIKEIEKIGTVEAITLILISIISKIIFNFPKALIEKTGQSAWINVVFVSAVVIVFVYIVLKIYEPFDGDILSVSEILFRKVFFRKAPSFR